MDRLLRRGIGASQKTRFRGKYAFLVIVLITWAAANIACYRSAGMPSFTAATAWAGQLTAVVPSSPTALVVAAVDDHPTPNPVEAPTHEPTLEPTPAPPQPSPTPIFKTPTVSSDSAPVTLYYTQAGDTIPALAVRFSVAPDEITSPDPFPEKDLINPKQLLVIPNRLDAIGPSELLLPDSEIVYSPSALGFDTAAYIREAGGYLSTNSQDLGNGWSSSSQVIERVAIENSINPRLLLALLEYQANYVHGRPATQSQTDYPMGYINIKHKGLYSQLNWAVQQLSIGYYGWRAGLVTELTFRDAQQPLRMAPELNAGTAALQYLFAQLYTQEQWGSVMYGEENFTAVHERMFGDAWLRAQTVEPLYPTNLTQPLLELPYLPGKTWALSGGPHSAWGPDGALAALDFAPASVQGGCVENEEWVTASASGLVTRAMDGLVVQDLDADGHEQTGWVLVYLHVATKGRVPVGSLLGTNDKIGHPSCEGGKSTGTHVHIARKYNGEWILADGPIPYVLSGWVAAAGSEPYKGSLTKGDITAVANVFGSRETLVFRDR
jgi:LasA protease